MRIDSALNHLVRYRLKPVQTRHGYYRKRKRQRWVAVAGRRCLTFCVSDGKVVDCSVHSIVPGPSIADGSSFYVDPGHWVGRAIGAGQPFAYDKMLHRPTRAFLKALAYLLTQNRVVRGPLADLIVINISDGRGPLRAGLVLYDNRGLMGIKDKDRMRGFPTDNHPALLSMCFDFVGGGDHGPLLDYLQDHGDADFQACAASGPHEAAASPSVPYNAASPQKAAT